MPILSTASHWRAVAAELRTKNPHLSERIARRVDHLQGYRVIVFQLSKKNYRTCRNAAYVAGADLIREQ